MESNVKPKGSRFKSFHKRQITLKTAFLKKWQIHVTMNTKCPSQLLAQRVKKWVPLGSTVFEIASGSDFNL